MKTITTPPRQSSVCSHNSRETTVDSPCRGLGSALVLRSLRLVLILMPMLLPPTSNQAAGEPRFEYQVNNRTITITRYVCSSDASEVIVPETIEDLPVTHIAETAFSDCTAITAVTLPNSVIELADDAFAGCENLRSITLSSSLLRIGGRVFMNCSSLESITLPETLIRIGDQAFLFCSSLTSVTIPAKVIRIGNEAFTGCTSLEAIAVDPLNEFYSSIDGVLFDKSGATLLRCPQAKAGIYTVPGGVTRIQDNAFSGCVKLTRVVIPDTVTAVGPGAFFGCAGLTNVVLPNTLAAIEPWTFSECTSLADISIPETVITIGQSAFTYCANLPRVVFPSKLTRIDRGAFSSCRGLTELTIPDSVTEVGSSAFVNCHGLTNITVGEGLTSLSEDLFSGCYSLKSITLPKGLTRIGQGAFGSCSSLERITLPAGVTEIGHAAFAGCSSLRDITLPNRLTRIESWTFSTCGLTNMVIPSGVTTIGIAAFFGCSSLTNIVIPDTVTLIDAHAFEACRSLPTIAIPESVITISDGAFWECWSLTHIVIPRSVTTIGDRAFYDCPSLEAIDVDPLNPSYSSVDGVLFDKARTTLIQFPRKRAGMYEIPNGVETIELAAFAGCSRLTGIVVPASVTRIGVAAFFECWSLRAIYFRGNAPQLDEHSGHGADNATTYYLPGSTGWSSHVGWRGAQPWKTYGPPVISDIFPRTAPPGTTISILGSNLVDVLSIEFNGARAGYVVSESPHVWGIEIPEEAATGSITITTPYGSTTSDFDFVVQASPAIPAPVITSISPLSGRPGTLIQIRGENLRHVTSVKFSGGLEAEFFPFLDTMLTIRVPDRGQDGPITVITRSGAAVSQERFDCLPGGPPGLPDAPQISSVSPEAGLPGTTVRISGTGFASATAVFFNGIGTPFGSAGPGGTELVVVVPEEAKSGTVTVANLGGAASWAGAFNPFATGQLSLRSSSAGQEMLFGTNLEFVVTVANRGLMPLENVTVRGSFGGGDPRRALDLRTGGPGWAEFSETTDAFPVRVLSVTPTQGTASITGAEITCELGSMPGGASAQITLLVEPVTVGTMSHLVVAGGMNPDGQVEFSSSVSCVKITPDAATQTFSHPIAVGGLSAEELLVEWPALPGQDLVLQAARSLPAPVWIDVEGAPSLQDGIYSQTIRASTGQRFFRLRTASPGQ